MVFGAGMRALSLAYELLSQRFKNSLAESLILRMLKSYFETPYAEIAKSDSGYFISRMYDEPVKVAPPALQAFRVGDTVCVPSSVTEPPSASPRE